MSVARLKPAYLPLPLLSSTERSAASPGALPPPGGGPPLSPGGGRPPRVADLWWPAVDALWRPAVAAHWRPSVADLWRPAVAALWRPHGAAGDWTHEVRTCGRLSASCRVRLLLVTARSEPSASALRAGAVSDVVPGDVCVCDLIVLMLFVCLSLLFRFCLLYH